MLRENTAASELPWTVGGQISVKDSFDFEFQSRLHECEATTAGDKSILLREVGTHLCAGFFCCPKAGYNWMTGWTGYDRAMISLWWERAQQRCGETPGQGQKNDIQTDRQNTHEKDSVDVLYRNKQGNCIDSFRFNRQQVPISL